MNVIEIGASVPRRRRWLLHRLGKLWLKLSGWRTDIRIPDLPKFVLIGAPSSWMTLTVAGLAMGMMIFLMASGLSLVFGLMDVLNFGHSAFVSLGAFIAATVLAWMGGWLGSDSVLLNSAALFIACTGLAGSAMFALLVPETLKKAGEVQHTPP